MATENANLVRRWFEEVWNQKKSETIEELMTDESVCYTAQGPMRGPVEFRQMQYEPLLMAFPDLRVEIEGVIEANHEVVVRWSATGTHTGPGLPVPPTQQVALFSGISWICVQDGKLHTGWQSSNISEVIRGLIESAAVT